MKLIVAALLLNLGTASYADQQYPLVDCRKFERLGDGSWLAKVGGVISLNDSRIDFSGSRLRPGRTRIEGIDVVSMLESQCAGAKRR